MRLKPESCMVVQSSRVIKSIQHYSTAVPRILSAKEWAWHQSFPTRPSCSPTVSFPNTVAVYAGRAAWTLLILWKYNSWILCYTSRAPWAVWRGEVLARYVFTMLAIPLLVVLIIWLTITAVEQVVLAYGAESDKSSWFQEKYV